MIPFESKYTLLLHWGGIEDSSKYFALSKGSTLSSGTGGKPSSHFISITSFIFLWKSGSSWYLVVSSWVKVSYNYDNKFITSSRYYVGKFLTYSNND